MGHIGKGSWGMGAEDTRNDNSVFKRSICIIGKSDVNSRSRKSDGRPVSSHCEKGCKRKIAIRPANESDNVGTNKTLDEPVNKNRPGLRSRSMAVTRLRFWYSAAIPRWFDPRHSIGATRPICKQCPADWLLWVTRPPLQNESAFLSAKCHRYCLLLARMPKTDRTIDHKHPVRGVYGGFS